MNYSALIENRKSVRAFTEKEVPLSVLEQIRSWFVSSAQSLVPGLKTELHFFGTDAREVLEGAAGYNSFLVGAPQYLVLLSEKAPLAGINAGFIMEDLVLKLTDLGLDTCWVTFADGAHVRDALAIESPLEAAAIVAFGYGAKTTRRLRLNILSMSNVDARAKHRYYEPKRSISDLVFVNSWGSSEYLDETIGFFDEMLWEAFYAASLAPSYLNRQAYGFLIREGQIHLVRRPDIYTTSIDGDLSLGIVLLHFTRVAENWAGTVRWNFGQNTAAALPAGHEIVASWVL